MRNPADTSVKNWYGGDQFELMNAYRWTAQSGTMCPPYWNSAQVYGHSGWEVEWERIDHWRFSDDDPPTVTVQFSGPKNEDGAYEGSVSITISASDPDGVKDVKYKLDAGDWTTYSSAINVNTVGDHVLLVDAEDNKGNKIRIQEYRFKVVESD